MGIITNTLPDNDLSPDGTTKTKSFSYDATLGTVNDGTDTVAGQLDKILSKDSPYVTRARTSAAGVANSRGLQNSTMAAQAGEAAAIDAALPIAQADAGTYSQQRLANQGVSNTASQFGAGAANQAAAANANAANAMAQQKLQGDQQIKALETTGKQQRQTQLEGAQQAEQLQVLRGTQAQGLADTQAAYQTLLETSKNATTTFNNSANKISAILNNPDTDAATKQSLIVQETQLLRAAFGIIGPMADLNLNALLTYGEVPA